MVYIDWSGSALEFMTRETATHLALSALSTLQSKGIGTYTFSYVLLTLGSRLIIFNADVTVGALTAEIQQYVGLGVELPGEVEVAVGEVCVKQPYPTKSCDSLLIQTL